MNRLWFGRLIVAQWSAVLYAARAHSLTDCAVLVDRLIQHPRSLSSALLVVSTPVVIINKIMKISCFIVAPCCRLRKICNYFISTNQVQRTILLVLLINKHDLNVLLALIYHFSVWWKVLFLKLAPKCFFGSCWNYQPHMKKNTYVTTCNEMFILF